MIVLQKQKGGIYMKQKISAETLIDIERVIREHKKTGEYNFAKLEEILSPKDNQNQLHKQALELAFIMPLGEMTKVIREYDESSPKMDELKFVSDLAKKYNVERGQVITRIQHVRRINEKLQKSLQ